MFVGYAEGHAGDCYQMWNPVTNKIYESRDVVFLQRMFYVKPDGPFSETVRMIPEVEGIEETDENEDDLNEEEMVEENEIAENGSTEIVESVPENSAIEESVIENESAETSEITGNTESVQEIGEELVGTTTRTGRSIRKPERLVEQCNISVEDIGYEKLLGLLPGYEYAS